VNENLLFVIIKALLFRMFRHTKPLKFTFY